VRSARRTRRIALLVACGLLVAVPLAGCTTTQETAARKQAQSKRILEKRELRRKHGQANRKRSQER
jgi:hypothetical protein